MDNLTSRLYQIEIDKYPFYNISDIQITISEQSGKSKYRSKISSRYAPEWSKWTNWQDIDLPKLKQEIRDNNIDIILEK